MKNAKRILSMMLVIVLTLSLCVPIVHADDNDIKVMINGEYINFDVEPQLVNGRTMVPFRAIFEAMGATVSWDQDLWQASGEKAGKSVKMVIDSNEVKVTNNGVEETIQIDQAPILIDGRTMVPVRFVAQAFDKIVSWDNDEKTVIILDLDYFVKLIEQKAPNFYEFMSIAYDVPETLKSEDTFNLSTEMDTESEHGNLTLEGKASSILNKDDAYIGMELEMQVSINDEKEEYDMDADVYFKDDSIVLKTNILDVLGQDVIEYNDKIYTLKDNGILMNFEDLQIPGVSSYQDLMGMFTNKSNSIDNVSNMINEELYDTSITVQDVKQLMQIFDLSLELISNDKFTKRNYADTTIYTWKITKEDISDFIIKLVKNKIISTEDVDMEVLNKANELIKQCEIIAQMQVKDSYPINSKIEMNFEMSDTSTKITLELNATEKITDINEGPFIIEHPDTQNVLDFNKYMEYVEEQQKEYQEIEMKYNLQTVQDTVTIYVLEYISDNADDEKVPSVKEALEKIYVFESNTWTKEVHELFDLEDNHIDLTQFQLKQDGKVILGQSNIEID